MFWKYDFKWRGLRSGPLLCFSIADFELSFSAGFLIVKSLKGLSYENHIVQDKQRETDFTATLYGWISTPSYVPYAAELQFISGL
jgi:hypothetical protein